MPRTLTVREVIAELQKLDPESEVRVQTDCLYEGDPEQLMSSVYAVRTYRREDGRVDAMLESDGLSDEDRAELREQDPEAFEDEE